MIDATKIQAGDDVCFRVRVTMPIAADGTLEVDCGESSGRGWVDSALITAHYPKGEPEAPKPEPAVGTPEWAEAQAKAGKVVRHPDWIHLDDRIRWNGNAFVWDSSGNSCLYPSLREYPSETPGKHGWEIVEDATPEPEQPAVLIGEWYDVDGDPTRVVGKSAEGDEYVCEFIDEDGDWHTGFRDADDFGIHLPNFDPATDKLIDGTVFTPKAAS